MRSLQFFAYYLVLALTFTSGAEAQRYKVKTLPSLPSGNGIVADGINKLGSITGFGFIGPHVYAILYRKGRLRNLGTLPGTMDSYGTGINALGQVTGAALINGGPSRAFLYSDGSMSDLGLLPGGTYSVGDAINDSGQITGQADVPGAMASCRTLALFLAALKPMDIALTTSAKSQALEIMAPRIMRSFTRMAA